MCVCDVCMCALWVSVCAHVPLWMYNVSMCAMCTLHMCACMVCVCVQESSYMMCACVHGMQAHVYYVCEFMHLSVFCACM